MKTINTFVALACLLFAACHSSNSQNRTITERKLVVASKETVKVKDLDLEITNKGCGRKWISEGDNPSYEQAYCDIIIKHKDTLLAVGTAENYYAGDIEIILDRMNPWGREEDSVPAGGLRLIIRRSPAFTLLEKYGWTPGKILMQSDIEFPDTIQGIPWSHYATCTKAIGYDLDSLAGGRYPILKIALREKGKRSGSVVWAHIVMDDGEAVTGWISSQKMAPGLAPLNFAKEKLGNW